MRRNSTSWRFALRFPKSLETLEIFPWRLRERPKDAGGWRHWLGGDPSQSHGATVHLRSAAKRNWGDSATLAKRVNLKWLLKQDTGSHHVSQPRQAPWRWFVSLLLCFCVCLSIFAEGEHRAGLLKRLSASELAHQVNAYVVGGIAWHAQSWGWVPSGLSKGSWQKGWWRWWRRRCRWWVRTPIQSQRIARFLSHWGYVILKRFEPILAMGESIEGNLS